MRMPSSGFISPEPSLKAEPSLSPIQGCLQASWCLQHKECVWFPPSVSFPSFFLFFFKFYLFIYLLAALGLHYCAQAFSLVAVSRGYSSLWCMGFSLWWPLLLWSTGSRHAGSVVVAHGLSCSAACEIFPDQGSTCVPALAGGFLTTVPPGKSLISIFLHPLIVFSDQPPSPQLKYGRQIRGTGKISLIDRIIRECGQY